MPALICSARAYVLDVTEHFARVLVGTFEFLDARQQVRQVRAQFGEEQAERRGLKRAWARLLAKVYEIDPLVCPKCGSEMKVIAVIQDPVEIRDILTHLVKTGRAPPGFDPTLMN